MHDTTRDLFLELPLLNQVRADQLAILLKKFDASMKFSLPNAKRWLQRMYPRYRSGSDIKSASISATYSASKLETERAMLSLASALFGASRYHALARSARIVQRLSKAAAKQQFVL